MPVDDPLANVTPITRRDQPRPSYREPPHNLEAEKGLLGAILTNNRVWERVNDLVEADFFMDPVHGRIYGACARLIERGQLANPVTLKALFNQDDELAEAGGAQYLVRLAADVVSVLNAQDYARVIRDCYMRRELIDLGEDVVNDAYRQDLDQPATEQIEEAEARLFNMAERGSAEGGFRDFKTVLSGSIALAEAAFKRDGSLGGLSTGLRDLDQKLGGLHSSDLIVLAGRPAMGKTALATNIAFDVATAAMDDPDHHRSVVAFFSLEMSAEQLATRLLAEQTGVGSERIRGGSLSNEDFQKLVTASQRLERLPLHIDDTPAITVATLRTRARRLKRQQGLSLIVVDYLQLMRPGRSDRAENRVLEISAITQGLKAVAKDLGVPVLALSQLSRAVENRDNKRPVLADLRDSGSIEQDADVVMFIFREEYYIAKNEPMQKPDESDDSYAKRHDRWKDRCAKVHNKAEVIIGKQRHGPTGTALLHFEGGITRFSDLIEDDRLPERYG